jgi:TetR/AcrR family transcriptional regulator, mexJK operon transcriptional repressor
MSIQRKKETAGAALTPAPRGRPRDPARRERILAAATRLFGESGLDGASLDRIAERAEVSKVTLYSYFESKEALFNATITEHFSRTVMQEMPRLDARDPRTALLHMASAYARELLNPQVIAHLRMLIGSSARHADLAQAFFETGPQEVVAAFEAFLKRANAAKTLRVANPSIAAEQLVAMVRGQEFLRALIGLPSARSARLQAKYIEACVDAFLTALGAATEEPG